MKIPFTREAFLDIFRQYNEAVWPVQVILFLIGLGCVYLLLRRNSQTERMIFLSLSLLWLWMGVVYQMMFFSSINAMAYLFGLLFIIQALMFLNVGISHPKTARAAEDGWKQWTGLVLIAYSLLIYPALGWTFGHTYPASPTFGVPCPTTIFTFGILMLLTTRLSWWVVITPLLWSVIGFFAAVNLSVPEDFGLVAAALVYLASRFVKKAPAGDLITQP